MDSNNAYATSGGHYYHQTHQMHPGAPGFEPMHNAVMMHNPEIVAVTSAYDTGAVDHYTGAISGTLSGSVPMQPQSDMSSHYAGDAAGYAGYHDETEYTPVTHRPSRAKKGKRVHYCDVCKKVSQSFYSSPYRQVKDQRDQKDHVKTSNTNSHKRLTHELSTCGM